MDDQERIENLKQSVDTLSYVISEVGTDRPVSAYFSALTTADAAELQSAEWLRGRFRDVWLAWLNEEHTWKLVVHTDAEEKIQGIVRIGAIRHTEFVGNALRDSLLEVAPVNRQGAEPRKYRGVGRALIARLIVESYRQGGTGNLLVRPVADSLPFYRTLGFQNVRHTRFYTLGEIEAKTLLASCLYNPII
jgi:predicted N-acetyltransferase YhbS